MGKGICLGLGESLGSGDSAHGPSEQDLCPPSASLALAPIKLARSPRPPLLFPPAYLPILPLSTPPHFAPSKPSHGSRRLAFLSGRLIVVKCLIVVTSRTRLDLAEGGGSFSRSVRIVLSLAQACLPKITLTCRFPPQQLRSPSSQPHYHVAPRRAPSKLNIPSIGRAGGCCGWRMG